MRIESMVAMEHRPQQSPPVPLPLHNPLHGLLLETVGCVARAALHFGTLEARLCSIHQTTCWPRKRHLYLLDPRTPLDSVRDIGFIRK